MTFMFNTDIKWLCDEAILASENVSVKEMNIILLDNWRGANPINHLTLSIPKTKSLIIHLSFSLDFNNNNYST